MKVTCISDLHGVLPPIDPTELLLIAGDICPATNHTLEFQAHWLDTDFRYWLKKISAKKIVGIAGNHDLIFQQKPRDVPSLPWTYLQDTRTEFEGLTIWGTPWQPAFYDWAFNLYTEADLAAKWSLIPDKTDIIVVHGPPHGYGDRAPRYDGVRGYEHTGSKTLLERIQVIKPKLVVCGHIHCNSGVFLLDSTKIINASLLNDRYVLTNEPFIVELENK